MRKRARFFKPGAFGSARLPGSLTKGLSAPTPTLIALSSGPRSARDVPPSTSRTWVPRLLVVLRIRVMTYNVHRCIGRGGYDSTDDITLVCSEKRPDLIALQELDAPETDDA